MAEERRRRKSGTDQSSRGRRLAGAPRPPIPRVSMRCRVSSVAATTLSGDLIHMETYEV